MPPVSMRENVAINFGEQRSKNTHSNKKLKGENGIGKKQYVQNLF